jgi:DNA repair protein RadC
MRLLPSSAIRQFHEKSCDAQCKLLLQNIKVRGSAMAISDWPEDDRPREKLLAKGPGTLSDAELLAIFLRTGPKGKSAVDLAGRCLKIWFPGWPYRRQSRCILHCPRPGAARSTHNCKLPPNSSGERWLLNEIGHQLEFTDGRSRLLRLSIQNRQVEVFVGLFLDAQNHVIAVEELFSGTLTQTSVFPRGSRQTGTASQCSRIIFAHNHPQEWLNPVMPTKP